MQNLPSEQFFSLKMKHFKIQRDASSSNAYMRWLGLGENLYSFVWLSKAATNNKYFHTISTFSDTIRMAKSISGVF